MIAHPHPPSKDFGQSFGSDPVAGPLDWRDDPPMDQTPSARATLDMETVGAAPAGTLISAGGVRRRFTGWTEFASAIQEWRAEAAAGAETETRVENPDTSERHEELPARRPEWQP